MDYQFRPFGVGVVMSQAELDALHSNLRSKWNAVKGASKDLALAVAEVSLRHTTDALQTACYELADLHAKVALKQSMRKCSKAVKSMVVSMAS